MKVLGTNPRRRRSGRGRAGLIGAALVVLAAAAIAVVALKGTSSAHHHAARAALAAPVPAPAPPLSPAGLPLAAPAFALGGVSDPAHQPVRIPFRRPPRAGILFDLTSGRVLWERNPTRRLPIASLTKMMTALVTVEAARPSDAVLVTPQALAASGSKIGLLPRGRHVRLETLLYGLMLPSGNDAAVALAQHVSRTVSRFVARMNRRAAELGLGCTRFSSPHGFYDRGNFSCAEDLAVLAHVDLAQPRIARVARTPFVVLPFPIKGGRLYLANNNPLMVWGYPGVTGLKTGYTVASGRCLVATVERHGVRLGVVLLDSPATATQARKLLDRAFQHVYHQRPVPEPAIPPTA